MTVITHNLDTCVVGVKIRASTLISLLECSGFTITDVFSRVTSANIVFVETENDDNNGSLRITPTHVSLEVSANDHSACVIGKSEFTFSGDAANDEALIIAYVRGMFGRADDYLRK